MEARLDLTALGLDALPTQIIMVKQGADGREALLPAHGALLTDGDDDAVLVTFELDATAVLDRLTGSTTVTISGDRAELGAWAGHAVELFDDGLGLDAAASDGIYTVTLLTEAGGSLAYKYLLGEPGDPSWDGVELDGDDRTLWVHDMDASGRVRVFDTFAQRGGEIIDP
jgi:hypothetical protein